MRPPIHKYPRHSLRYFSQREKCDTTIKKQKTKKKQQQDENSGTAYVNMLDCTKIGTFADRVCTLVCHQNTLSGPEPQQLAQKVQPIFTQPLQRPPMKRMCGDVYLFFRRTPTLQNCCLLCLRPYDSKECLKMQQKRFKTGLSNSRVKKKKNSTEQKNAKG